MNLLRLVDLFGVAVFAVSGALKAREKQLDPVGFLALGVVTATGGGVVRDLILGRHPPFVFQDSLILPVALVLSLVPFFIKAPGKGLEYFDAMGLGFYTAIGGQLAADAGLMPIPCVLLAVTTAVGGGVLREVLVNDLPFIFRGTLYVTASVVGACVLLVCRKLEAPPAVTIGLASALTAGIRIAAIQFNLKLPSSS